MAQSHAPRRFESSELLERGIVTDWRDLVPTHDVHDSFPSRHVEVTVSYENYGERVVSGTLLRGIGWGGHPTIRVLETDSPTNLGGSPGHLWLTDSSDTVYALWNKSWEGRAHGRGYKYRVNWIEIEVRDHEPTCPICDTEMILGRSDWDPDACCGDGYSDGWLCPECFPARIKEGIR